jgi:predicted metal-binding membrane protein
MVNVRAQRATLALAAGCWAAAAWQMQGMDMGVASHPGTFGKFALVWVTMMAAMMLPGAAPAIARASRTVPFAGWYLGVWALAGVAAYALDRPHGTRAAGLVVIAAGVYELTPVKRRFRQRCREAGGSGLSFGLCCLGSSAGLMAMLVALDVMSLVWMLIIAVIACAHKLLPPNAAIDIPVAMAITGLGIWMVLS